MSATYLTCNRFFKNKRKHNSRAKICVKRAKKIENESSSSDLPTKDKQTPCANCQNLTAEINALETTMRKISHEYVAKITALKADLDKSLLNYKTMKDLSAENNRKCESVFAVLGDISGKQKFKPSISNMVALTNEMQTQMRDINIELKKINSDLIVDNLADLYSVVANLRRVVVPHCNICMSAIATIAAVPCGHLQTCEQCINDTGKCYICRTKIQSTAKIYIGT